MLMNKMKDGAHNHGGQKCQECKDGVTKIVMDQINLNAHKIVKMFLVIKVGVHIVHGTLFQEWQLGVCKIVNFYLFF